MKRNPELPAWPGSDTVYRRCQAINESICRESYAAHKAGKRRYVWTPPEDVQDAIRAMNAGDEESLKAWAALHRDRWPA